MIVAPTGPAADETIYPIDGALQAAMREARERRDPSAIAAVQLALHIRSHRLFRALVVRATGIPVESPRGLARTDKTALLGQAEPGTGRAWLDMVARLIANDLGVPEGDVDGAAWLALVLAQDCARPAPRRRRASIPASTESAT